MPKSIRNLVKIGVLWYLEKVCQELGGPEAHHDHKCYRLLSKRLGSDKGAMGNYVKKYEVIFGRNNK